MLKDIIKKIKNNEIESLNLSGHKINAKSLLDICNVLRDNHSVKFIDLSSNNIGTEGALLLAKLLETNHAIQCLNISSNVIGNQGITFLARALEINHNIKILNLSKTGIGPQGLLALVSGLKFQAKLKALDLSYNNINNDGLKAIVDFIGQSNLALLDLEGNKISGIEELCSSLHENNSLVSLNLRGNQIGDNELIAIGNLISTGSKICFLKIANYFIDNEGVKRFARIVKNSHLIFCDLSMRDHSYSGQTMINFLESLALEVVFESIKKVCTKNIDILQAQCNELNLRGNIPINDGIIALRQLQAIYINLVCGEDIGFKSDCEITKIIKKLKKDQASYISSMIDKTFPEELSQIIIEYAGGLKIEPPSAIIHNPEKENKIGFSQLFCDQMY